MLLYSISSLSYTIITQFGRCFKIGFKHFLRLCTFDVLLFLQLPNSWSSLNSRISSSSAHFTFRITFVLFSVTDNIIPISNLLIGDFVSTFSWHLLQIPYKNMEALLWVQFKIIPKNNLMFYISTSQNDVNIFPSLLVLLFKMVSFVCSPFSVFSTFQLSMSLQLLLFFFKIVYFVWSSLLVFFFSLKLFISFAVFSLFLFSLKLFISFAVPHHMFLSLTLSIP